VFCVELKCGNTVQQANDILLNTKQKSVLGRIYISEYLRIDNNVEKYKKYVLSKMHRKLQSGLTKSVVFLVSVQGMQGCAKWGPRFRFTRFEGPLFLV